MHELGDGIWQVRGPDVAMPGGVRLPVRSTVVRLADRSLLVYSPVRFTDADAAAIDAAGEVAHVVAPNTFHHLFARAAKARWPRATLHAPAGLAARRPELTIERTLGDSDPAWRDTLDALAIEGAPRIDETVLLHRPTGTVICADLVFHVAAPATAMTRLVLAMMGVGGGRLAQSRAWRLFRQDRAKVRGSLDRLLAWPITQIAPCHGDPVAIDPPGLAARLARAYGGRVPLALRPGATPGGTARRAGS